MGTAQEVLGGSTPSGVRGQAPVEGLGTKSPKSSRTVDKRGIFRRFTAQAVKYAVCSSNELDII